MFSVFDCMFLDVTSFTLMVLTRHLTLRSLLSALFLQQCHFLRQAGHSEKAVSLFQAMVDFTFFKPDSVKDLPTKGQVLLSSASFPPSLPSLLSPTPFLSSTPPSLSLREGCGLWDLMVVFLKYHILLCISLAEDCFSAIFWQSQENSIIKVVKHGEIKEYCAPTPPKYKHSLMSFSFCYLLPLFKC